MTDDPHEAAEARHTASIDAEQTFAMKLDEVAEKMRRQCAESFQGRTVYGMDYAGTGSLSGRKYVWCQDAVDVLPQMTECRPVMEALYALMRQPAARAFLEAFANEYVNRHAESVAEVEMRK